MTPLLVAIEMGYGHLRAAWPLGERLGVPVLHADRPPLAEDDEERLWARSRRAYEMWCRVSQLPVVGAPLRSALDSLTYIPPLHPYRDLSAPNRSARFIDGMAERGLGEGLIRRLRDGGETLLTTFFTPAVLADRAGCERVACVVTDSDVNRVWAPFVPQRTKIQYLAPSQRVVRRLQAYGVPPDRIRYTGFPLPHELVGGREATAAKVNLAARLGRLDPARAFRREHDAELRAAGLAVPDHAGAPPQLTFAVGGAGAQSEMAHGFLPGLARPIRDGALRLTLVAGVRAEVADAFHRAIAKNGLDGTPGITVLHEPDLGRYFARFHALLGETDILWTKPSEMTFFAALGLPLILAPPVGVHEQYNRRWAQESGAGLVPSDARYAAEWIDAWLGDGTLAGAAWAGFRRLPKLGLYNIIDALGVT